MAKVFTQAGVEKFKPIPGKRRVIRDGASTALFLIVQSSGHKSWMMRFRYGAGATKIFLGPLNISGRRPDGELVIGQPLTLVQARSSASKINADRAAGIDVIAVHRARKHRRKVAIAEAHTNAFSTAVRDFIVNHAQPKTRSWKQTASILGLDIDLNVKSGGLAERWGDRDVKTIDAGDLFSAIEKSRRHGIPGMTARHDRPSEARARKTHKALRGLFSWLLRHRRVAANPMTTSTLHPRRRAATGC